MLLTLLVYQHPFTCIPLFLSGGMHFCIYPSHFSHCSNYTTEFSSFLRSVKHSHSSVFICGDFNINLLSINWDFINRILESINTKNRLYKRFMQTDKNNVAVFDNLKAEYHIYRARLRRTIREAKRMFYARTFLLYKMISEKHGV